jgi:peptidoglycan/LPS O-acetylase OafA/YrhL
LSRFARVCSHAFEHSYYAVSVFIVLSGFCLGLPVVGSRNLQLSGGFWRYVSRRARRILPPYYAALALSLLILLLVPSMTQRIGDRWDVALPGLNRGQIITHLLLLHNVHPRWLSSIDPPMWSIATEWQIYFALPLLLVCVRRMGLGGMLAVAFTIGLGIEALPRVVGRQIFVFACPHYLGLFGLGLGMALLLRSPSPPRWVGTWPWRFSVAVLVALVGLAIAFQADRVVHDVLGGLLTASLIAVLTPRATGPTASDLVPRRPAPIVESRAAIGVGGFSYSLYLIHYPLLALTSRTLQAAGVRGDAHFTAILLATCPLIMIAAYGFSVVFERPFMPGFRRPRPLIPQRVESANITRQKPGLAT